MLDKNPLHAKNKALKISKLFGEGQPASLSFAMCDRRFIISLEQFRE